MGAYMAPAYYIPKEAPENIKDLVSDPGLMPPTGLLDIKDENMLWNILVERGFEKSRSAPHTFFYRIAQEKRIHIKQCRLGFKYHVDLH